MSEVLEKLKEIQSNDDCELRIKAALQEPYNTCNSQESNCETSMLTCFIISLIITLIGIFSLNLLLSMFNCSIPYSFQTILYQSSTMAFVIFLQNVFS